MAEMKVAAFMPVLNEGGRISRAIRSLRNQTHPVSKLIVVDGGSTDSTHEEVRRHAEQASFDIELEILEGEGVRYSSQYGAKKAADHITEECGEDDGIVLRLEGDSALEDHFLDEAVSYLQSDTYTVFGAPVKPHDPRDKRMTKRIFTFLQNAEGLPKGRGMAFRAQDFYDVDGYRMHEDENIQNSKVDCLEDGIIVSKLRDRGKVAFSHDTYVNSTVPSTTATSLERWRLAVKIEREMGPTKYFTKIASPLNKLTYASKRIASRVRV
ncbi:MAG: glycosyltransferase [Candidatus Nanohaloarchaeota archaeon QJJ-5]|nr:glycosyltransferase [Candidatus Nanohaloarchaeota archaeon QJJ-5]